MTNLLIGYPEIPEAAITCNSYANVKDNSPNEYAFAPAQNLWTVRRSLGWASSFEVGDHYIEWDLGADVSKSANFIGFARLDRLCNLSAKVGYFLDARASILDGWTNVDHYGNPEDSEGVNNLTKYGTRGTDDYFKTFTASAAYRYWRLHLDSINGANFYARLSKLFFGTVLNLGQEPNTFNFTPSNKRSGNLRTTSDSIRISRAGTGYLQYDVTWEWVTDAKVQEFYDKIVEKRDRYSVFLYSATFHPVLRDLRMLHAYLVDEKVTVKAPGLNTLTCKFEELVG